MLCSGGGEEGVHGDEFGLCGLHGPGLEKRGRSAPQTGG